MRYIVIALSITLLCSCVPVLCMEEAKGTVLTREIVCYDNKLGKSIPVPESLLKQSKTIKGLIEMSSEDMSAEDVSAPIPIAIRDRDWKGLVQPVLKSIQDKTGAKDIGPIIGTYIEKRTTVKGKLRRYVRALNGADYLDVDSLQQAVTKSFVGFLESSAVSSKDFKALQKLVPPMQDELARALNYPIILARSIEHVTGVCALAFSLDGTQLASSSSYFDCGVKVWNSQTYDPCVILNHTNGGHKRPIYALAFSPDGKQLASGSNDGSIQIRDAQTYALLTTLLTGDPSGVGLQALVFKPNDARLISGLAGGIIQIWDGQTYALCATMNHSNGSHSRTVWAVACRPDGEEFASGSADGSIKIWDGKTYTLCATMNHPSGSSVWALAFSPDGGQLVSGCADASIGLWDVQARNLLGLLRDTNGGHSEAIRALVFRPGARQLISGSDDRTIKVWDLGPQRYQLLTTLNQTGRVAAVAFKPDGTQFVSASFGEGITLAHDTIRVWNSANGSHIGDSSLALLLYFAKRKCEQKRRALVVDDPDLKQLFDRLPEHEQKHFAGLCEFASSDR